MSSRDPMGELIVEAARAGAREGVSLALSGAELDTRIEQAVERVLERRQSGALVPFHAIKGGTPDSARMWLNRHPEIRALGKRVGNRLLFSRDEVMAALKGGAR